MLLFYCCRDVEAYTDCTSAEIVHHRLTAAEDKAASLWFQRRCVRWCGQEIGMLFLVNCYHETVKEAVRQLPRLSEAAIVVLDSRWREGGRRRVETLRCSSSAAPVRSRSALCRDEATGVQRRTSCVESTSAASDWSCRATGTKARLPRSAPTTYASP